MATNQEMRDELSLLETRRSQLISEDWVSGVGSNGRSVQFGDRTKQIEMIDRRITELKLSLGVVRRGYLVGRK
ncbi:hypothetical protein COO20_20285 [Thalassospira marina]|uniref:Uncharacterized protein n=1 Tax=Thalassospira marina TaxID=2048283 RepID=A0A2N3KJR1_9PROT|nr:hypothetical protein COO20_20285 [Thalassospira marina]